MNSGYNPVLFTPNLTSKKQMKSNQPPHRFGGSQVITGLDIVSEIRTKVVKPVKIHFPR